MEKRDYTVIIEQDEDGVFVGSVPSLQGCHSEGDSLDELLQNLKEVIRLCERNSKSRERMRFVGVQSVELT